MESDENNVQLQYTTKDAEGQQLHEKQTDTSVPFVNIQRDEEKLFHYDIYENPPFFMTIVFAMQVLLENFSFCKSQKRSCLYDKCKGDIINFYSAFFINIIYIHVILSTSITWHFW